MTDILPLEIWRHILSYNTYPYCLYVCYDLYEIEVSLLDNRHRYTHIYDYLESPLIENDREGYLFLLYYTNKYIDDVSVALRHIYDPIDISILVHRYRGSVESIVDHLYDHGMTSLIDDVVSVSGRVEEVCLAIVDRHDLHTLTSLLDRGGVCLYTVMSRAILSRSYPIIDYLVETYGMEHPISYLSEHTRW